ncbi:MAG: hypothetical protein Q7U35_05745 [Methanobacteriaceae archaeon]|nr:hypothetical protein [Methanobacteriaceae archaeon]
MVNYWLWVEKEGGIDGTMFPDEKWIWDGCDYDTEEDDLILIYRTNPNKFIQYLVKATSDSYLRTNNIVDEIYSCNCEVLYNFNENSLTLKEMQGIKNLKEWYPLKVNFVKMKFPIDEEYWNILKEILAEKNHDATTLF